MTIRILGIESSCDETAAAVVADGRDILSNIVASQTEVHRKYGGVVPELASREHLRRIVPIVREALVKAGLALNDIDAIGVTHGPGLTGSLLVGVTYAKAIAFALGKPLLAVNHLAGHVHAVLLEAYRDGTRPVFPAVCLIVSGGHTLLYDIGERPLKPNAASILEYRRLGGTRDDAAGEAYDKVAKLLALGYPGGPIIDQLADPAQPCGSGDPGAIRFGSPKMRDNPLDFSFSGVKTAVLYHLREHPELQPEIEARQAAVSRGERTAAQIRLLCGPHTLNLIASFQHFMVRELVQRALAAAAGANTRTILVSGGVAANRELRSTFLAEAARTGLSVFFPSRELSTDNAAMIAAAAFEQYNLGERAGADLNAFPDLRLGATIPAHSL